MTKTPAAGQAVAEFALALPVFILVILGIFQAGILLSVDVGLSNVLRDAARAASTYRVADTNEATAACPMVVADVRRRLAGAIPGFVPARILGDVTYGQTDGPAGSDPFTTVSVRATYAAPLIVPIVGSIFDRVDGVGGPPWAPPGDAFVLSGEQSMRVEGSEGGAVATCVL